MNRRTFHKVATTIGVAICIPFKAAIAHVQEAIDNTQRGKYAVLGFTNTFMEKNTRFPVWHGITAGQSRELIKKYGAYDPITQMWWVKVSVRRDFFLNEVNLDRVARYVPTGGLAPSCSAHAIAICDHGKVVEILKNRENGVPGTSQEMMQSMIPRHLHSETYNMLEARVRAFGQEAYVDVV
jgi:hypothetical protein